MKCQGCPPSSLAGGTSSRGACTAARRGSCPASRFSGVELGAAEDSGSALFAGWRVAHHGVRICPRPQCGARRAQLRVHVLHEKRPAGLSLVRQKQLGGDGHGGGGHKRCEAWNHTQSDGNRPPKNRRGCVHHARYLAQAILSNSKWAREGCIAGRGARCCSAPTTRRCPRALATRQPLLH